MKKSIKAMGGLALAGACVFVGVTISRPTEAANPQNVATFHGGLCQMSEFSPSKAIGHTLFGVHNNSSTDDLIVDCPMPLSNKVLMRLFPLQVGMLAFDRSTTKDISCTFKSVLSDASIKDLGTMKTSGGGPGTGQNGGVLNTTFFDEQSTFFLECTIPPMQSGAASHLQAYKVFYDIR